MASYDLRWKRSAVKDLRGLPRDVLARVHAAVESLIANPFPSNSRKVADSEDSYRMRVGDYRVVYSVFAGNLVIEVIRVGHRQNVYKN